MSVLADYGLVAESAYNDLLRHALVLVIWAGDGKASDDPEYQDAIAFVSERRSLLPVGGEAK